MRKYNYRSIVHIEDKILKLGFRARMPEDAAGRKVRVQAIFEEGDQERRFPMEVSTEEDDLGPQIFADAEVELPYVFVKSPQQRVNVIFSVWLGMEETILRDQPFPIQEDYFQRPDEKRSRNPLKYLMGLCALPFWIGKEYLKEKDKKTAFKAANAAFYNFSGYSFSQRQRNTDYYAAQYQHFLRKVPVKKNNILFLSERLPEEGGNLALLMEACRRNPEISVSRFIQPRTVEQLSRRQLRDCARKCARAHVIVLEDFYPQLHSLKLRPETRVVQLWHACGAFKTFGLTRMGKQGGAPQSSLNHRNYDLAAVSSEAIRGIYAEAFGIHTDKVQALGTPRTDVLYDDAYKEQTRKALYDKYPQLKGRKVVLFAPTFRGDGNRDAYYPDQAFDVNHFLQGMPEDVFCIVKHHPFVHQEIMVEDGYKHRVLDLTGKDHINDLMLISDLLITDYSSSVFEAAILDLPMLFYAFDKKEYIESRDFYCDYDHFAPGYIESDFDGMTERARAMLCGRTDRQEEQQIAEKKVRFRQDFLSALDGHSTQRIADYIVREMLSKLEK